MRTVRMEPRTLRIVVFRDPPAPIFRTPLVKTPGRNPMRVQLRVKQEVSEPRSVELQVDQKMSHVSRLRLASPSWFGRMPARIR
jgi:hypothetical protein